MNKNTLLIIKAPNRGGKKGCQFLLAYIDRAQFDVPVWTNGKNDALILALANIHESAIGQFRSRIAVALFLNQLFQQQTIEHNTIQVTLNFALPSRVDIANAHKRHIHALKQKAIRDRFAYIAKLEHTIKHRQQHIASILRSLDAYRTYLKQPHLLSGIRLHYKRVLIADKKQELKQIQSELKEIQQKLHRACVAQANMHRP